MKIILLIFTFIPFLSHGGNKTLYGPDNRISYKDSKNTNHQKWAQSTAGMINKWLILDSDSEEIKKVAGWTLANNYNVCIDEKFANYTSNVFCTGFLITPDILMTAGHCISNQFMCDDHRWVFDYRQELIPYGNDKAVIKTSNIYKCKEIIKTVVNYSTKLDYAIIRLDRKVPNRDPLKVRMKGKIPDRSTVMTIGHPSGVPTIITPNGIVRSNDNPVFFTTTLDTFGGNSGSPVINQKTGVVEGILVRGETDYTLDAQAKCDRPRKCKLHECNGEEVTRITNIKALKDLLLF